MKLFCMIALFGGATLIFQPAFAQTNTMDTLSYSFGLLVAKNMQSQGVEEVDPASMLQAITDVFEGNDFAIQPAEANAMVQQYFQGIQARQAEEATKEEREFLTANKEKEGVMTTASGLQYEILTPGNGGTKPTASNRVTVHYEGKLLDGTVFDSSYKRGEPTSFGLSQVIKGWTEGLQLMEVGSKYRFYIPHNLGYGAKGSPPRIPGYSTLVFDVELLEIQ